MSLVAFGVPYTPPPPPPVDWAPFDMTWTSADGQVWPLSDPAEGFFLARMGILGLHLPGYDRYTSDSPGRAGTRFRGSRGRSRPVEWPIYIYSDESSVEWLARDRSFWAAFDTDRSGTWTVTAPDGQRRTLSCRLTSDGDKTFDLDPALSGWSSYLVQLIADEPWWKGDPVSRSWASETALDFFDPAGPQLLNISSSGSAGEAIMSNPGDEPAWMVWTVTAVGGTLQVDATVDGGMISTPTIASGKTLVVDTNPATASAWVGTMTGGVFTRETRVFGQIDPWQPRRVPRGAEVPLSIEMTGTGVVKAEIVPLYRRAI